MLHEMNPEQRQQLVGIEDIAALPEDAFPFIVLSNGYMSSFGHLVSVVTDSFWNHAMWYWRPGFFASQWWWFREFPLDHFATRHSLKFWHNPNWSRAQRATLRQMVEGRLSMGKWRTRYDVLGVIGKLLHFNSLHIPWLHFCSETISWLAMLDPDCHAWLSDIKTPTPEDVNDFFKQHDRYAVFGRTQPD